MTSLPERNWYELGVGYGYLGQNITNNDINHDDDDKYLFSMCDALYASSHLLFQQSCETEMIIIHFLDMETEMKKGEVIVQGHWAGKQWSPDANPRLKA